MATSAILILVTGIALVISGIIQATLYGLTVYHGLILLALSWLTVLAAIPPYIIIASKIARNGGYIGDYSFRDFVKEPRKRWLVILHSLHLSFTAIFGLWLFSRISTFDTTPAPVCTSSTVFEFLGRSWSVLDPSFRRLGLALYSIVLLPPLNLAILTSAFGLVSGVSLWLWSLCAICCSLDFTSSATDRKLHGFFNGLPPLLLAVFIVISIEETINVNHVAPGETQWTLGQTLALFVSLIPLYDLLHWIYEEVSPSESASTNGKQGMKSTMSLTTDSILAEQTLKHPSALVSKDRTCQSFD